MATNVANLKVNKWYPARSEFSTHQQWNAHVQTLNQLYETQDQLTAVKASLDLAHAAIQQNTSNIRQANIGTNINGIIIKKAIPTAGQTLKFNASTGQAEWT